MARLARKALAFAGKVRRRGTSYLTATARFYASALALRLDDRLAGRSLAGRATRAGLRTIGAQPGDHARVRSHFRSRGAPVFHFAGGDVAGIVGSIPAPLKLEILRRAESVLRGRFAFRGLGERVFEDSVEWRATIDGSVSWRWDLNRHAYFVDLAAAYHYSGESRYGSRLSALWQHWIASNPREGPANWDQPFEVAARLNHWIWAFFLLVHAPGDDDLPWSMLVSSLTEHAAHLYRKLEYHWPNNHLLLEAKALAAFGMLFPEFDPERRFWRRGHAVLLRETQRQVLPDGGHSELSTMYHRIVAGELFEWLGLAQRNNLELPQWLPGRIECMTAATAALSRPDGTMALLGDSAVDDNYIRFEPARRNARHLNYWLGPEPPSPASTSMASAEQLLTVLPEMGYAVIHDAMTPIAAHLTMDVGPFIRNPAPDHGHCDALSFELYGGERPLLIDPGVCFPSRDAGTWRRYFRGTSAHNTVTIDSREQSELLAMSDVGARAQVRLLEAGTAGRTATVRASVRPYWADDTLLHTRGIRYSAPDTVDIDDDITGNGEHSLAWHFHFAEDLDVRMAVNRECEARDATGQVLLRLAPASSADPFTARLVRGGHDPTLGWMSRNSAQLSPTTVAVYEIRRTLPFRAGFRITCLPPRGPRGPATSGS